MSIKGEAGPRPLVRSSKRRWLRYSLRTLLLSILVLGCVLGWFARLFHDARRQRDIVGLIEVSGGGAWYDDADGSQIGYPSWCEESYRLGILPASLEFHVSYPITTVRFGRSVHKAYITEIRKDVHVSPKLLRHVSELRRVKKLYLYGTNTNDECLKPIAAMRQLEVVELTCTQVTASGINELRNAIPSATINWGWEGQWYKKDGKLYRPPIEDAGIFP